LDPHRQVEILLVSLELRLVEVVQAEPDQGVVSQSVGFDGIVAAFTKAERAGVDSFQSGIDFGYEMVEVGRRKTLGGRLQAGFTLKQLRAEKLHIPLKTGRHRAIVAYPICAVYGERGRSGMPAPRNFAVLQ